MLRSKATAALMRLKEMDRKYNIKHNEGKRTQRHVSTESSLGDYSRIDRAKSRTSNGKNSPGDGQAWSNTVTQNEIMPQVSPKPKVEVRIPIKQAKDVESSITDIIDSIASKKSAKISPKTKSLTETDQNIGLEKENDILGSEVSLESVSSEQESISEVNLNVVTQGPMDSPRNNTESSICTILSRRSEISETISEAAKSINEHSSRKGVEKSVVKEVTVAENSTPVPDIEIDERTIEDDNRSNEENSEITSELTTGVDKDGSVNDVSPRKELKTQYEDDTFEDASSSSGSSCSAVEKIKGTMEEDTIISGVKQIKITPHKQIESMQRIVVDADKGKEIVELVAPKILQSTSECDVGLDEELSNYVRTTENIEEVVPISLLKLCKQTTPRKHIRRGKRHRKSSKENTEEAYSVASEHEKMTERKENNVQDDVSVGNGRTMSRKIEQEDSPSQSDHSKAESVHSTDKQVPKNELQNIEPECPSEEKLLRETPKKSDVTSTLRNLNKDAINAIVRRHRIQTPREVSNKFKYGKNVETVVKLPPADASKNVEDQDCDESSFENVTTPKNCGHDQKSREKKVKTKKYLKSKSKKASNCKVEGKQSRFECRQMQRLRKLAATMRLQQEREDIRNYLLELERTRLEYGPGASVAHSHLPDFKPLEFPKIAAFLKPDLDESSGKNKDGITGLQERLLMIRQCLKDQYILYRDYSSLARTVNTKYIPASLEDAKRQWEDNETVLEGSSVAVGISFESFSQIILFQTIRQLQKATIKSR